MLEIKEIEVRGKRKAVELSTSGTDEDESQLLELIWDALEFYEKTRRVKIAWSSHKANGMTKSIVLVYYC